MEGKKIALEIAETEISNWISFKKISEKKTEQYKDNIETLVTAMTDGLLVLDPQTHQLKQTLKFPLEADGRVTLSELTYLPRLTVGQIQAAMSGVKATETQALVCAYASALTGQQKTILKALDSEDFGIAQAIVIFFL